MPKSILLFSSSFLFFSPSDYSFDTLITRYDPENEVDDDRGSYKYYKMELKEVHFLPFSLPRSY